MSDKNVPPAVGEFAVEERAKLLARVAELESSLSEQRRITLAQIDAHAETRNAAALKQPSAGVDERAVFEAHMASSGFASSLDRLEKSGDYRLAIAQDCWNSWQARAQLAAPAGVVLPPSPYMPGVEPESLSDYERGEAQGRCDMWEEVRRLNAAAPSPAPATSMCATMHRPVSECGCPDCGSSLIDWPAPASDVVPVPRELPDGKCCEPTEQDLELLKNGDYTPEELWGAREPSCPKCVKKPAARGAVQGIAAELERITHDERTPNEISQELAALLIVLRALLNGGRS